MCDTYMIKICAVVCTLFEFQVVFIFDLLAAARL